MVIVSHMYKCELCKKVISPNTKAIRIPVETRTRQYPPRQKEVSGGRGLTKTIFVPGGVGSEIVREIVACPDCAAQFLNEPEQASASA